MYILTTGTFVSIQFFPAIGASAAAAKRLCDQEEEETIPYSENDINGWEFKILRSSVGAFRDKSKLNQILKEEASAGWQLVETFDNMRIRLKRRISDRSKDNSLKFDAYRTTYPASAQEIYSILLKVLGFIGIIIAVIFGTVFGILYLTEGSLR